MADNAGLSSALDGIPMVADAAAREARFPLATRKQNQRVFRLDTGVQQRWSGSAWLDDTLPTVNVRSFGAAGDGTTDDTTAVIAAINALPAPGGRVKCPAGKYRFTSDLSAAVNAKEVVIFEGENGHAFRGNNSPGPLQTVFYVKELTTYLVTKSGTTNDVLNFEGIFFDGANGGTAGTTCPGIVYGNGQYQYRFALRRCVASNFGYAHTNTAGSRALVDIQPVLGLIDECELSYVPNGRLLYIADGSTQTMIRRTEFTVARECFYVYRSNNIVFDHCVFESATTIGASYLSSVKLLDPWFENIGFNNGTAYTSGIALRNHGLTFGSGALSTSAAIITPIQQLYGSLHMERAVINSFATGGAAFTAAAWMECLGQGNTPATGGSLFVSGRKVADSTPLFASTMALTAAERDPAFFITVEDSWSTDTGSSGASLFAGSGLKDYRKVNAGTGRITMNGGTNLYLFQIRGGRLLSDVQAYNSALSAAPGATVYPAGDQWEIGDRIVFPVPVAGGNTGVVCTTAGTSGAVWKTYGAIAA